MLAVLAVVAELAVLAESAALNVLAVTAVIAALTMNIDGKYRTQAVQVQFAVCTRFLIDIQFAAHVQAEAQVGCKYVRVGPK